MKRRAFIILLVLSLLVSTSGIAAMAADEGTVATIGDTAYTSLQAAVDAVYNKQVDDNSTIVLEKDTTEQITVNCDVYVNLNGNDIAGVTVTAGTFYGVDTQTVDFTVEDGNGYGTIGTYTGDVQAAFSPEEDGYGYLMFSDNGANASFHYVELRITDMTLHPQNEEGKYNPSVSYKSTCAGDEVVAANVDSFGVALSVAGVPGEIEKEKCGFSEFDDFVAGKEGNAGQSTMLRGIMKESYAYLINKRNATMKVYGQAYIKVNGENIYGKCEARDLKEQTEGANRIWTKLNSEQKEGIRGMYNRHIKVMQSWDLVGIAKAPFCDYVEDAVTWYEEYQNLPIANADMTEEELRQLAVDYFRMHLTYKWTPNKEFKYLDFENDWTTLAVGEVYEGMPYCMNHAHYDSDGDGVFDKNAAGADREYSVGAGNLYKVMNYYDPATGVLDIAQMGAAENVFNILTSNCTGGLGWAWERVSNAAKLYTSAHYVPANGILPVSGYTWNEYDFTYVETTYKEDGTINRQEIKVVPDAFSKVIASNTKGQFYKAYSRMQPGDGLISDGHVMMCTGVEVVRKEDGSIDSANSYVWYIDQNSNASTDRWVIEGAAYRDTYTYINSNGCLVRKLGGLVVDPVKGNKKSFYDMLKAGYIPVTIPEFLSESELIARKETAASYFIGTDREEEWYSVYEPAYDDLIEKRKVEAGSTTSSNNLETKTSISLSTQLFTYGGSVTANYIISNFRVSLEDPEGNVIMEENPHISTTDRSHSVKINRVTGALQVMTQEALTPYAGANNIIKIQFQLANGQWVDVLNARLRT